MTREQDLQRRLVDWLTDGPVTAPTQVVDEAIKRTVGRRQHHPLWGWLLAPLDRFRAGEDTRVVILVVVLALTMLAALARTNVAPSRWRARIVCHARLSRS